MDRVRVIHDAVGHTLTVWLGDPRQEYLSTLTDDEVVIMKDRPDPRLRDPALPTDRCRGRPVRRGQHPARAFRRLTDQMFPSFSLGPGSDGDQRSDGQRSVTRVNCRTSSAHAWTRASAAHGATPGRLSEPGEQKLQSSRPAEEDHQ
jgi:hypothetical protein